MSARKPAPYDGWTDGGTLIMGLGNDEPHPKRAYSLDSRPSESSGEVAPDSVLVETRPPSLQVPQPKRRHVEPLVLPKPAQTPKTRLKVWRVGGQALSPPVEGVISTGLQKGQPVPGFRGTSMVSIDHLGDGFLFVCVAPTGWRKLFGRQGDTFLIKVVASK